MKKIILLGALLLAFSFVPRHTYAAESTAGASAKLIARQTQNSAYDPRVVAMRNVLARYDSTLAEFAPAYVKFADKYGLDWKLLISISGVESTFGKQYISGTYNVYGWGSGTIYFKDWSDGIETISRDLRQKYMDKWGASDVWSIGPFYAESPTWAVRVNFFMEQFSTEYIKLLSRQLPVTL